MNVELELSAREDVPGWLAYGTPVFTVVAALAVGAVALLALEVDPVAAYETMFVGTLTSEFGLTETLVEAVPLVLTGLAVYLPLKAGLWNIGAEGQLYLGAIAGTWVGLNVSQPPTVLVVLMLLAAALAGAFWAGIAAVLRAKYDVNEIITTLLLTFVAVKLNTYLVRGPMQGGLGNFSHTAQLPEAARLRKLFGTELHVGIFVALAAVAVVAVVMRKTRLGFQVRFVGSNAEAADQAGMSTVRVYLFVLLVGGAMAGLAGISEISGVQNRLRAEFSAGWGFTAIPIALLGRNGAFRVLLAALFFAVLFVGGGSMELEFGVPAALVDVIQALVILFLITAEFFKRYRVNVRVDRGSGATAGSEEVA